MYQEKDVVHEAGKHWVLRENRHGRDMYLVMRKGLTRSYRVAVFDLGEKGLGRAIARCNELEAAH